MTKNISFLWKDFNSDDKKIVPLTCIFIVLSIHYDNLLVRAECVLELNEVAIILGIISLSLSLSLSSFPDVNN